MCGSPLTTTTLFEYRFDSEVPILQPKIAVCNGCCCGRVDKGNKEIPVQKLKQAWKEKNLGNDVKLSISTCLGPCSRNNVSLITIDSNRIWLGSLEEEHYDSIIDWAQQISVNSEHTEIPENLKSQRFIPLS